MANRDYIHKYLYQEIHKHRILSFDNFAKDVRVHPIAQALPLHDRNGKWVGFDKYNFDLWNEPLKPVNIRISSRGIVKIWYCDDWRPVSSLMKQIKAPVDYNAEMEIPFVDVQRLRLQHQSKWWMVNGQKFRLLDLPAEIRDKIYGFALEGKIEPFPNSKLRRFGQNFAATAAILARQPNASLLKLNRQVNEEAGNILSLYTTFYIEHYCLLGGVMSNIEMRRTIRHLELHFSHFVFLKVFGCNIGNELRYDAHQVIKPLRLLKLNRLEIRLTPPSFVTGCDFLDGACQRTVVDWIFQAAWPHIKGHPVEFTGFIKKSQKLMYEGRCSVERKRFEIWKGLSAKLGLAEGNLLEFDDWIDEEDGGVRLGGRVMDDEWWNEELKLMEEVVMELRPECSCTTPCTLEDWTEED